MTTAEKSRKNRRKGKNEKNKICENYEINYFVKSASSVNDVIVGFWDQSQG